MTAPLSLALLLAVPPLSARAALVTMTFQWRYVDVSLDPADPNATTTLYCRRSNRDGRANRVAPESGWPPLPSNDCYYWKRAAPEKPVPVGTGRDCEIEAVSFGRLVSDGGILKLKAGAGIFPVRQQIRSLPGCRSGDRFAMTVTADAVESLSGGSARSPGMAAGGLHENFLVFRHARSPYRALLVPRDPQLPDAGPVPAYVIKALQQENGTRYSVLLEPFAGAVRLVAAPGAGGRAAALTDEGRTEVVRACVADERCVETSPTGSTLYPVHGGVFVYLGRSAPGVRRRSPIRDDHWLEKVTPLLKWSKVRARDADASLFALPGSPPRDPLRSAAFWCYHPDLDGATTLRRLLIRDGGPESLTCAAWEVAGDVPPEADGGRGYATRRLAATADVTLDSGRLMLAIRPGHIMEAVETPNGPPARGTASLVKVTALGR